MRKNLLVLKVVIDGGELTKRGSHVLYKSINVNSVAYAIGKSVSRTSMQNILNQLGNHDFSCGQAVHNFQGRKVFPDEMNRYCLNLILGKCDRNCCTKENDTF